jgi:hypothetical protein
MYIIGIPVLKRKIGEHYAASPGPQIFRIYPKIMEDPLFGVSELKLRPSA